MFWCFNQLFMYGSPYTSYDGYKRVNFSSHILECLYQWVVFFLNGSRGEFVMTVGEFDVVYGKRRNDQI